MITASDRRTHEKWLLEITGIPTAAGCEQRVIAWVERWLESRPHLQLRCDKAGNLLINVRRKGRGKPIFITAHLDHPAFVVTGVRDAQSIELEFRGGVHDPYFEKAAIEIIDQHDRVHQATIQKLDASAKPFKRVTAKLQRKTDSIRPGDIGRWSFGAKTKPRIVKGVLHAPACDDLAGVAAALAALDVLSKSPGAAHVGVLLTRCEEVGFIGAIAACKLRSVPISSRLICLENSRSFPESPIGGGPIVRVGDRISVFGPSLTNRISAIMTEYARETAGGFKWQRKLMPGGACEATTFSTYGYESTCLCLALGNYHNMADIDGVQAGRAPARVAPEFISINDYHGLIDMLIVACTKLDSATTADTRALMERLIKRNGRLIGMKS